MKAWLWSIPPRWKCSYLPGYSLELNPEGRLNANLKYVTCRKIPARSKAKLRAATEEHMIVINREPERSVCCYVDPHYVFFNHVVSVIFFAQARARA